MAIRISNITATFANASHRYDGIGFNANVVSAAANSNLLHLLNTNVSKFAIRLNGDIEVFGGIIANNNLGNTGQVLTSTGSGVYWANSSGGPGGSGTVTSVASGNGLTGGPVTTTGTISVLANSGIVANSSGVFVDPTFIATLTANNTSFVGSVSAANVVSNAQLSGNLANYQTTAGLASNVATLTANLANFIIANNGIVSNSSGVFVLQGTGLVVNTTGVHVQDSYIGTLTANNTSFVGSVSAANVVSNAQLSANLANYQTTAGLAGNVATLTANNTSFVGGVTAANVVSNAQLSANLANYLPLAGGIISGTVTPNSNTVSFGNTTQRWVVFGNTGNFSGNLTITGGIIANGGIGVAGQILASNGSSIYWTAAAGDGTVTQVSTGNGLTGGPVTTTGTISVLANNGITANATGTFVTQGSGLVVNATGVHVSANNGITANSTGTFVTQGTGLVVNATGVHVNSSFLPNASFFRNRIINGSFDIWQRATSNTTTGYVADRWLCSNVGSTFTNSRQTFTVGQTAVPGEPAFHHRTVVTSVAAAGNYAMIQQRIESVRTLAGQTATLTFYAKADTTRTIAIAITQDFGTGGTPSANVSTHVSKPSLTSSWQKFTVTVTVPSITGKTLGTTTDGHLALEFWFDAGSTFNTTTNTLGQQSGTFDIAQVQLEAGAAASDFETRPIGLEFSLCQRYCQKFAVMSSSSFDFMVSYFGGTTILSPIKRISPAMRVAPSASISVSGIEYYSFGGVWTATTLSYAAYSNEMYHLTAGSDGDGRSKLIRTGSAGSAAVPVMTLSAEL